MTDSQIRGGENHVILDLTQDQAGWQIVWLEGQFTLNDIKPSLSD